jgi:radical SAM superfamily enzyme YgiQ (UPF0313 family)
MATLTLITPTPPDISAFGVRSISAYLRAQGHRTKVIFLPGGVQYLDGRGQAYRYDPRVLAQIVDLCRGSDLVGLSFMTNYFDRAVQLTAEVRARLGLPVIWGGIHATCRPAEALEHADFVCVGEGETALEELLAALTTGGGTQGIAGVWCRRGGQIVDNGPRPLIVDLNTLPHFDVSNQEHYLLHLQRREVVPLDDALFQDILPVLPYFGHTLLPAYRTMTDRGCPHACTYCNVPTIKGIFEGGPTPYFRHRAVEHVMDELAEVKARFPRVAAIQLFDDTFFARPRAWLAEFAQTYRARVGLPLYCQASPTTMTRDKLEMLLEAGLVYVEMGVQTGSQRIRALYNRRESDRQLIEAATLVNGYVRRGHRGKRLLPPDYHVIIDNPWEKPADALDTVRLLFKFPKPFGLCIASLNFFPQTELYRRAVAEGMLGDEVEEVYRRPFFLAPERTYPNFLLYLMSFQRFPRPLMRWLLKDETVRLFQAQNPAWLYRLGYILGEGLRLAAKGLKTLARGDLDRVRRYLKARRAADHTELGADRGRKG